MSHNYHVSMIDTDESYAGPQWAIEVDYDKHSYYYPADLPRLNATHGRTPELMNTTQVDTLLSQVKTEYDRVVASKGCGEPPRALR